MLNWPKHSKVNLHYTIKIHKNNGLRHQKSKPFETKICRGNDGGRKFTKESTKNPYKRFRSKKTRLAVHDVSRSCVNFASHKYVAKTESQQREKLHIHTLLTVTPFSWSSSVPLEQSINTSSEGNMKETQFYIRKDRVFALHLSKKNPKTNWKTRRYRTSKNSGHRNIKCFNDIYKKNHLYSYKH